MEGRRSNAIPPIIRVTDMQKNLNFYTRALGFQVSDKLTSKDGKMVYAPVGFDSPLLVLLPVKNVQTSKTKDDVAKNKLDAGIEFHFGMNESKNLAGFFTEVLAKGITVINQPAHPNDKD